MLDKFLIIVVLSVAVVFGIRNENKVPNDLDNVYPYVVALRLRSSTDFNGPYACGGAIITTDLVLTSADCLPDNLDVNHIYVIAGSVDLKAGGSLHIGKRKFIHEDYKSDTNYNNIAILQVTPHFSEYGTWKYSNIRPVELISDDSFLPEKVYLPGWGSIGTNQNIYSNILQSIELKTINSLACFNYLNVVGKQMCTLTQIGQGACHGDQGSPLVVVKDEVDKVIAIATAGYSCGSGLPDVYTKVAPFIGWINTICGPSCG